MERNNGFLAKSFDRRRVMGMVAAAGAAIATGAIVTDASANTGVKYTTTAAVNLRKKPNTSSQVLLVLAKGVVVIDYDGEVVNGFRSVDYNGTVGWVSTAYIVKGVDVPQPVIIGGAKTTSNVNFRSAPNGGNNVIKVIPAGTWVEITATVQNGYRWVVINGKAGWIADAYLGGGDEGAFVTTAKVNMRSGAGTGYSIKLVLPKGVTVVDYDDEIVNGFRHVDYNGTTGWVSVAYLAKA